MDIGNIFLIAFAICNGLTLSAQPKHWLNPVRNALDRRVRRGLFPLWLAKPLLLCETCMASIYGTGTYLSVTALSNGGVAVRDWLLLVPFVFLLALCNYTYWLLMALVKTTINGNTRADKVEHP